MTGTPFADQRVFVPFLEHLGQRQPSAGNNLLGRAFVGAAASQPPGHRVGQIAGQVGDHVVHRPLGTGRDGRSRLAFVEPLGELGDPLATAPVGLGYFAGNGAVHGRR